MVKDLVEVFNALLTPVIAFLALYIARQQYKLQHKAFNGQMYERRFVVFKAFMAFFGHVMRDGNLTFEQLGEFYASTSEADFLFSDKILKKREELYERGVDFASEYAQMYPRDGSSGLPVGPERGVLAQKHSDHLKWFLAQIRETKALFKPEMVA